jgi:hypothetical protein
MKTLLYISGLKVVHLRFLAYTTFGEFQPYENIIQHISELKAAHIRSRTCTAPRHFCGVQPYENITVHIRVIGSVPKVPCMHSAKKLFIWGVSTLYGNYCIQNRTKI